MFKTTRFLAAGALLGAALLLGCNSGNQEKMYTVSGAVTFQGSPVTEGQISFENPQTGFVQSADLGEEGKYTLQLPAGDYKVSISPPLIEVGGGPDSPPGEEYKQVDNIPDKYRSSESSGLTATINGDKTDVNFDMTP
ncbi:hypothetical protein JCM19992_05290 [Thermostilla marina]